MIQKFWRHLTFAGIAVALTVGAANANTACTAGEAVTAGTSCTLDGLTFSWELVSFNPSTPPSDLEIASASISGDDYTLTFQFTDGPPPPVDILMVYEVSSTSDNITQVDSSFNSSESNAGIQETVCSADPGTTAVCPTSPTNDVLATYTNPPNTSSATFGPEQNVWIIKDIGTGSPVSISSFTDSVVATPEPSSIGLLLVAAFGIAASARKLRKA